MDRQHSPESRASEDRNTLAHNSVILEQFTRQARPFATSPAIRSLDLLGLIVDMAAPRPDDNVLDVACGPGLLTCAFAARVRQATGIDLTPAMLEQAKQVQREQGLTNLTWQLGDVARLPYEDGAFSVVATRFSFHHFSDPLEALKQMRRVCRPGGRIVVADSAPAPEKAEAFNAAEKLRDPSHTWAFPLEDLRGLFAEAGLEQPRTRTYRFEGDLDDLLERSYPNPGDEARIRAMYENSLDGDKLDMEAHWEGGKLRYAFPVAILAAKNA